MSQLNELIDFLKSCLKKRGDFITLKNPTPKYLNIAASRAAREIGPGAKIRCISIDNGQFIFMLQEPYKDNEDAKI